MYPLAPATATRTVWTATVLPLGILELLPGSGLPILLAFPHAGITREQAGLLEHLAEVLVELHERPGQAVSHGAGLPGGPAAADGGEHVELPQSVLDLERLGDNHAERFAGKVVLEGATIDDDAPAAGPQPHAGHGRLPPAGAVEAVDHGGHQRASPLVTGSGRWDW